MYSTIKIECISAKQNIKYLSIDMLLGGALGYGDCFKKRWWVAEIIGLCPRYRFQRKFISQRRDYAKSNSVGSRGVYASYMLGHGKLYEISSPVSWRNTDRYFVTGDDVNKRLNAEEAALWLKTK